MKESNEGAKQARAERARPLQIVYRLIEELKPDPTNARIHSKKQIGQIKNSIKTFGFNVPILTDRDSLQNMSRGDCRPACGCGITTPLASEST
jgi:hypothetical protein